MLGWTISSDWNLLKDPQSEACLGTSWYQVNDTHTLYIPIIYLEMIQVYLLKQYQQYCQYLWYSLWYYYLWPKKLTILMKHFPSSTLLSTIIITFQEDESYQSLHQRRCLMLQIILDCTIQAIHYSSRTSNLLVPATLETSSQHDAVYNHNIMQSFQSHPVNHMMQTTTTTWCNLSSI